MERKHIESYSEMKSECQREKALIEAEQRRLRQRLFPDATDGNWGRGMVKNREI